MSPGPTTYKLYDFVQVNYCLSLFPGLYNGNSNSYFIESF